MLPAAFLALTTLAAPLGIAQTIIPSPSSSSVGTDSLSLSGFNASGSAQTTTGGMSASSAILTLSSALDFQNGQGICVFHVGPATSVQQPTGASATPVGLTGSTTYNYTVASCDGNGGVGTVIATFQTTTGTATLSRTQYVNYNQLTWTPPASGPVPAIYAVYGDRGLGGALVLIGVTSAPNFQDIGDTGWDNPCPYWVPLSPPNAPLAQSLITSVVSGGGTTSLTLAAAATTAGTGVTVIHDDTVAVVNWLTAGMTQQKVALATAGTYIISTENAISMLGDIEVRCSRFAKFKTGPHMPGTAIKFEDFTSRDRFGLTWVGGSIDFMWGIFVNAASSNSGIEGVRLAKVFVDHVILTGASTFTRAAITCDTGIGMTDCKQVCIIENDISGAGDLGIYLTGGGGTDTSDDGGQYEVIGNNFTQCWVAGSAKRSCPRVIFEGNTAYQCGSGFTAFEAGTNLLPGQQLTIANNILKYIQTAAIDLHVSLYSQVFGNKILDFGYLPDGTTPSTNPNAIVLRGSSDCDVGKNLIALVDWTNGGNGSVNHTAVRTVNYTFDGTTYVADRTMLNDIVIINVQNGVVEDASNGTPGPTLQWGTQRINVTRDVIVNSGSYRFYPDPLGVRFIQGAATESVRFNGGGMLALKYRSLTLTDTFGLTRITRTTAVIAFGTVGPGASVRSTVTTITGLDPTTSTAYLNPETSASQIDGIVYQCFVTSTGIVVQANNITGSPITIPSDTFTINLLGIS